MISSRVKHDNESGFGHGIILDRIESPPELQQYREDILHQPLLQEQEQPPQQPQQQPQQQQKQQPSQQQQAHQSSPVVELGENQEIPQQQTHSNTEEVKLPSTVENMLLQNDAYGGTQDSQGTEQKRFQNFVDAIRHEMSVANVSSLKGYHLLFFPVCSGAHFFLIVINNKSKKVEILDNLDLPEGIPFENKYEQNPEKTFEAWLQFCELEGHPLKKTQIKQYELTLPPMPWKNRINKVDRGVYAMSDMET
ncbi:hypothetical protein SOVF_138040 [Spinacia oleracea]|nr:hypothetical protein SOVF_138040 [Spinacia oleracea]